MTTRNYMIIRDATDRDVSSAIARTYGAKENLGRYNKCLIDPDAETFVQVRQVAQEARDYHYEHTLPWGQHGVSILPAKQYWDYSENMKRFQERFHSAVRRFIASYPSLKERARRELNGMFRESEYPPIEDIERRFRFHVAFFPIPEAGDWRVSLGEEEEREIKRQIEEEVSRSLHDAMRDLWLRLLSAVKRLYERMSAEQPRFRDSVIEDLRALVDLIPRLNVTEDQRLEELRKKVASTLAVHSPQALRIDPDKRAEVAKKADQIVRQIESILGGSK